MKRAFAAAAAALISIMLCADQPYLPEFRNIASRAGLVHRFRNGGNDSKRFIIETTGSGVGWIDYDNDGLPDAFVLSGQGGTNRMYHNDGGGRFTDVTGRLGLQSDGWAQGVCAGDFDNDGYTDLLVTYWGANRLYRNVGGRRFQDVTAEAGLNQDRARYNTGCAFLDYDHDGKLDLFVANYLKFDPATTPGPGANPYCWYRGLAVNCGPRGLPFDRNLLYHNDGNGRFRDVSEPSGIAAPSGHYSLGVLTGDFDNDGWTDIYVACDQTPSLLYVNQHDGTFREAGVLRGVAYDENGKALSGMGAAAGDYDHDGRTDIFRTNFSDERETLYHNRGSGEFDDVTAAAGLSRNTRYVGWGCGFFDFDNDGWEDLFLVNGHVFPEVDRLSAGVRYRDRAILYRNLGNGRFEDISGQAGPAVAEAHAARGAAVADIDDDGTLEVLINNQNETPSLWKQSRRAPGHWLLVQLEGTRSNRSAIGAVVKVTAGPTTQTKELRSGGSYLSQDDLRLHFGLGSSTRADRVQVRWPNGLVQSLIAVEGDQILKLREPDGDGARAYGAEDTRVPYSRQNPRREQFRR